jgi:serine/threonine protein kinase/tetratricopeptide (TPR) repeat protein
MGVVYEAFDEERRAAVALKTLNRFDGDALARFKREFRALQGLVHPNLVALDELFFEDGRWFFTMELLGGVDFVSHVTGRHAALPFQSTVRESAGETARAPTNGGEIAKAAVFDEQRLRDGLRQLLEGLSALHAVDKVHRDIKPSNVLVTPEGRVVLLDFGLVTEASGDDRSSVGGVVGTPAYMAPEQAASRDIGPAADLYAVGVMLYEVLAGRLPIDGPQLRILLEKQTREPAAPSSLVSGVPADLDALCVRLLGIDPAVRPSVADVQRALALPRTSSPALPRTSTEAPIFVGRSEELSQLHAAFEVTRKGGLATVLACGESGIGKSYLVRRFTGQLLADHPEAMLLEGRCYERETVPYKTLDGIVDALSRRLSRMSAAEVEALLPTRTATLAQVFPAMLRIPRVAKEHAAQTLTVAPQELRQRAFLALRELFSRIALRRPTVVVIDDLQWADDDGLRALAEILRPPEAPPLLLLGTVRVASRDDPALTRARAVLPGEARVMDLTTLGRDDARALAVALLERGDAGDGDPEVIADEAGGHPLFVEELARHVALGGSARDDVKLDDAIWSRIVLLEGPTREMAELVAIAGKPIPQQIAAAAARIEPGEFNRRAATLRVSNLVRTGGARWADAIEPYHDRVREAVTARIEPERARALHEALAAAFEASSHGDPETLAVHWRDAGNSSRAARYAEAAGDQATKTYAFDRAAQWYEQALGLTGEERAGRRELRVKLGDALSSAGRGGVAAKQFEAAAEDSPPMEALELRRRAADQLLRAGHVDEGLEASRAVLESIGLRFPRTRVALFATLVFYRVVLALRGLRFRQRERGQVTVEELARVDTCLMLGLALSLIDPIVGALFQTRAVFFALRAGELERMVRALSLEMTFSSQLGSKGWRRTKRLMNYAQALTDQSGTVLARAYTRGTSAIALYFNGRYADAVPLFEAALDLLRDGSTGLVYEENSIRFIFVSNLFRLGRFEEARRHQEEGLRAAVSRGDIYGTLLMASGWSTVAWLMVDRPEIAEEQVRVAIARWSTRRFDVAQYLDFIARIHLAFFRGDAMKADVLASELYQRVRGSSLRRSQSVRLATHQLDALAALYLLERGLGDRDALLRRASARAAAMTREGERSFQALATLVRAGVALRSGPRDEAIGCLGDAIHELETAGMMGYATAARDRAARLRDDASTAADIDQAAAFFRSEGVVAPDRMIAMLVPGFAVEAVNGTPCSSGPA